MRTDSPSRQPHRQDSRNGRRPRRNPVEDDDLSELDGMVDSTAAVAFRNHVKELHGITDADTLEQVVGCFNKVTKPKQRSSPMA